MRIPKIMWASLVPNSMQVGLLDFEPNSDQASWRRPIRFHHRAGSLFVHIEGPAPFTFVGVHFRQHTCTQYSIFCLVRLMHMYPCCVCVGWCSCVQRDIAAPCHSVLAQCTSVWRACMAAPVLAHLPYVSGADARVVYMRMHVPNSAP